MPAAPGTAKRVKGKLPEYVQTYWVRANYSMRFRSGMDVNGATVDMQQTLAF